MSGRSKTGQVALRIVCAMLLVFLSLAHRPMIVAEAATDQFETLILPDGSVASLCLADSGDTKPAKHVDHGCEACRISSGVVLPTPFDGAGAIIRSASAAVLLPRPEQFRKLLFPPNAPPRGPPSVPDFI